ncbi:imidazolonepropionase-like amidohydrolase [Actinomadura coerulea]|uniref:Imidazolonepropionase-like amidohydrolase n=1 Tax=Actinomadura coerulea TaxID=46159 RepID=A0A7X0L099_9ACTN|nr:imidazolonepropionase-like amidohydrolase [Actinomadura coerulea]GGP95556.1 hydrolase [Actinomadura coerulea]
MSDQRPAETIVIRDVRIFDGVGDRVRTGHVVVEGTKIKSVGAGAPPAGGAPGTVVDGRGGTLIPGLSDAHVHLVLAGATQAELMLGGAGVGYLRGAAEARAMLMRGFTTVRDMAGDTGDLKRMIDAGALPGPRIYPSQAGLSQTGGHGDFGMVYDVPTALGGAASRAERLGLMRIADGTSQVLAGVREQLRKGASQIKMMAGGGVASAYDHLDVLQYTAGELRAGVEAAADWGTYVAVHVYTGPGIRRAVRAGVQVIEHGHLAEEDDLAFMADEGVWLCTQPFAESDHSYPDPASAAKNRRVCEGVEHVFGWAREHGVRVAFGTDLMLDPARSTRQSEMLARMAGLAGGPLAALKIATSGNAELFRKAGPRDPYQNPTPADAAAHGEVPHLARLGVIAEGAWADLLLVGGDPTRDLALLADPAANLKLIVKDGQIFKNTLP